MLGLRGVRRFERVARAAIARAGALIRARYGGHHAVACKAASGVDIVTRTDRDAEALIVGVLRGAFPDHGIVAEESEPYVGQGHYCWYVDPLDGTTNFAHGYPHCSVSVALEHEGTVILGLVHDPLRREIFAARRGGGAQLNGRAIRVSQVSELSQALLATGFPADRREHARRYVPAVQAALERARCLRRSGSAALDLSYVACGRLDGYWEWRLKPWDVAAGRLLVEEAGGRVSDLTGRSHDLMNGNTAASNSLLHADLVGMLRGGTRRFGST
jgi:myo-inositol-1(or 4)-monophosphatase